jgi:hypothetical protein
MDSDATDVAAPLLDLPSMEASAHSDAERCERLGDDGGAVNRACRTVENR